MKELPLYDPSAAIACTITEGEVPSRTLLVERLRASMTYLDRTPAGLLLHFPVQPDIEEDLRRFAVDEKRCCQFWGFEVTRDSSELTLRWEGPTEAQDLIDRLDTFLRGREPLTSLSGLL